MSKFWKKNKAAISGGIIALIALGGFVGLGYYYSKADIGYDYVGAGAQVDSLNYNTGTGNMYRITTITNEGLLTPTTDFGSLQALITEDLLAGTTDVITANGLTSIQEYELAAQNVLLTLSNEYSTGDRTNFDGLNENEKTLVILASKDANAVQEFVDANPDVLLEEEVLGETDDIANYEHFIAARSILAHARPVTYVGDDATESFDSAEWDPSGQMISAYAFGTADTIYYGEPGDDGQSFRFRLRDGSLGDGASTWQTWKDTDGTERVDRVSAADVAFGISRQVPSMLGSAGRYMYTSIGNFKGAKEAAAADKLVNSSDSQRYMNNDGEDLEAKDVNDWTATDAIYYGLVTEGRTEAVSQDEAFTTFGVDNNTESGVVFYDPDGYEDLALEEGSAEYSYIDFNTTIPFSTFPTTMASTGFWPMNWEWFIKNVGRPGVDAINDFGTSEDFTLSNGAQQVTTFDNLYGYTTEKNENYYDADLVTVDKASYRMISEASTQVAMFENGQVTYIDGADSNSKTIQDSEIASSWLPDKFTKPAIKYVFFNMGTDRLQYTGKDSPAENARYTSDPNFRRAIMYLFDTNVYHQLNNINTAYAVSTFEPAGMYMDASGGNDLVTYMTDVSTTSKATEDPSTEATSEQLEFYGAAERKEALNGVDFEADPDPTYSEEMADYYFQIFLNDMKELGVDNIGHKQGDTNVITLTYLTSVGETDPFYKTMQQTISTHTFTGDDGQKYRVDFYADVVNSGVFFQEMYAADYDMTTIQWSADYLDAWSNIGIFNIGENSRGGNSLGGWNMWDGSDYTFDDSVYGAENTDKARLLFNDGFAQFHENGGANANITGVDFTKTDENYATATDIETGADFAAVENQLWEAVLSDNEITSWEDGTAVATTDGVNPIDNGDGTFSYEQEPTWGLNYNAHSEISGDPETRLIANILFEVIVKDAAATVTGTTESQSISPTRALLEGDPIIGYCARTFSFDITKAHYFWKDVKGELMNEFDRN